jgi:hypothetical protein
VARLVFISPYLKGGKEKAALSRRTKYIATREGVELLRKERGNQPETEKQRTFIQRLLKSYPQIKELGEYEDYAAAQTMDSASELIERAWEQFIMTMEQRENFIDYVSHRPGVQKTEDHGLWDRNGKVQNLSKAVTEIAEHEGIVWTPVISLRREDAERLGYTDVENWQALINACSREIADGYKISLKNLRWYAALHEKEKHVHVHMVVFSANPREGYLTRQGIRDVKSALATHIFEQDLLQVYERKTEYRNELQRSAQDSMAELIFQMETGTVRDLRLRQLTAELAERLKHTKGKKVYGYLPPQVKRIVDEIVDELSKDERIAAAYTLWLDMRDEVWKTYSDTLPERGPLSQQKEFKPVRNMVIREALKLSQEDSEIGETEPKNDIRQEESEMPWQVTEPSMEPEQTWEPARSMGDRQSDYNQVEREQLTPVGMAVIRMLHHMGRIFRDNAVADATHKGIQIDRKRKMQLQEKRIVLGHKPDDHEEELHQTMQ